MSDENYFLRKQKEREEEARRHHAEVEKQARDRNAAARAKQERLRNYLIPFFQHKSKEMAGGNAELNIEEVLDGNSNSIAHIILCIQVDRGYNVKRGRRYKIEPFPNFVIHREQRTEPGYAIGFQAIPTGVDDIDNVTDEFLEKFYKMMVDEYFQ